MNTISVRLTFTDDELFDWFITPKKVNNELPSLVVRLLTAYATNDDLAYQIDQFLDKDEAPETYEAREAIMQAIMKLNVMEANANQELESIGGIAAGDTSEADFVMNSPTPSPDLSAQTSLPGEAPDPTMQGMINPADFIANAAAFMEAASAASANAAAASADAVTAVTPEVSPAVDEAFAAFAAAPSGVQAAENEAPSTVAPVAPSYDFEGKVFSALETVTSQIAQLTNVVAQLANTVQTQPVQFVQQPAAPTAQQPEAPAHPPVATAPVADEQSKPASDDSDDDGEMNMDDDFFASLDGVLDSIIDA